jgi:hypothetical protein
MATRRRSKPVPLEVVQNAKEPEASSDLKMLTLGLPQYLLSVGLWQNPLRHEGSEGELVPRSNLCNVSVCSRQLDRT